MKHRLICMLLAAAMLLSTLPLSAAAAKAPDFSGTCGEEITWELDPAAGILTIDGKGAMPDYSYSEPAPWYACRSRIFQVVITGEITELGAYAFYGCQLLLSVDASACTFRAIGEAALQNCMALQSFLFTPGETLELGADAFAGCAALTSLKLNAPEGSIGAGAFAGCLALETVSLPVKAADLGADTFAGCAALKELTLPETLDTIGKDCFRGCIALTKLSFPESLQKVERYAFSGCGTLTLEFAGDAPEFAAASDPAASFPSDSLLMVPFESEGWGWPIFKGYTIQRVYPALTDVFQDLAENAWYLPNVQHVYFTGRMNGVQEGKFAPLSPMTRGQLVTVLYRIAGEPEVTAENPFTDVPEAAYYNYAVRWAQENGIVTGLTSTTFGPERKITRQQMAAILYRYAAKLELDLSQRGSLEDFVDQDLVDAYASDPMSWCVAMGFINGKPGGKLDPQGSATRAEIAKILTVFETYLAAEEILSQDDWVNDYLNPDPGPEIDREDPLYLYAQEIFTLINAKRSDAGLSELKWNDYIFLASQIRAKELAEEKGFSHTRPNGSNYATVLDEFKVEHTTRNEIIARGYTSAQALVDAWASTSSSSPVISALVYSNAAVGVYQAPPEEEGEEGRYYYVLLVTG